MESLPRLNIGKFSLFTLLKQTSKFYLQIALALFFSTTSLAGEYTKKNGFVIDAPLIPEREILHGGPSKDGIPSIDEPKFISGKDAKKISPESRVLGINYKGQTKAYPIDILNFHEIVNDQFADQPVVVSFCPLCGTGMAYEAFMKGEKLEFGVSGLLYNSNLLIYDRSTDTLWSQVEGLAVNGAYKSQRLKRINVDHTSWQDWYQRYPDTLVLTRETGYWRDYDTSPYPGYQNSEHVYFPVDNVDRRYHPKENVIGIEVDGKTKVYPFVELDAWVEQHKQSIPMTENKAVDKAQTLVKYVLPDTFAGKNLLVYFTPEHRTAYVLDGDGQRIPSVTAFWFAWMAFYPKSEVYSVQ